MSDIFYLSDATKEQKIEYYEQMEKNWENKRNKEHNKIFIRIMIMILVMLVLAIAQFLPQAYGYDWTPIMKVFLFGISILLVICIALSGKEMVMGIHHLPPVELVGWWQYAEEQYGITPNWKKKG